MMGSSLNVIRLVFLGLFAAVTMLVAANGPPVVFSYEVTREPVYPSRLTSAGTTTGYAEFLVLVNKEGILEDFLLREASHLIFGQAAVDALPHWRFDPPLMAGLPVNAIGRVRVNFRSAGSVVTLIGEEIPNSLFLTPESRGERKGAYQIAELEDLDDFPVPIKMVEPIPPSIAMLAGKDLELMFEFYIDAEGRVRMPSPYGAKSQHTDTRILEAVQRAVLQWRFEPGKMRNENVVTRVLQPIRFTIPGGAVVSDSAR
ncbi:energy transducer TonB [Opitutaceae bacterium]|nr:energy transducer TonB [Opitutaceae bacterium]